MNVMLKAAAVLAALAPPRRPRWRRTRSSSSTSPNCPVPAPPPEPTGRTAIDLAVADINAKGGILGGRSRSSHYDTQTNPGNTRAAVQRAIDEGTYAVLGPVLSGPIGASMQIAQRAEIAQIVGGEAAA